MAKSQEEIILDIKVKYDEAVNGIAKFNKQIEESKKYQDDLKKANEALAKAYNDGSISQTYYNKSLEENAKKMIAAKAEIDYNKKAIQALNKEMQNNLKADMEKEGSLNHLRAALASATAKYAKLDESQRNNTKSGLDLKKTIVDITEKIKKEEEFLGDHRRSVGDYETTTRNLRSELKQYVIQLQQMTLEGKRGSSEFKEMQKKVAKLKTAIDSSGKSIKNMASSTQAFDGINQGLQTLIGTYGLYQSALGLSDEENKKLDETMKKLQIAVTALNSLTAIQKALLKESAMMTMLQNTATGVLNASTKAATATMRLFGVSVNTTSTAFKVLRGAIIATGFGLLIVAIGELVAHWEDLTGWLKKSSDGMSGFGKALNKVKEVAMGVYEVIKTYILTPFRALPKIMEGDFKGAFDEIKKGIDVVGNYQKGATEQMAKNQTECDRQFSVGGKTHR